MHRPWIFLVVIAAIIAAYIWVFVWTDSVTQRTPTRPAPVAADAAPAEPG